MTVHDQRKGAGAEAGYMLESHLWGGILSWGGTNQAWPWSRITTVHDSDAVEWKSVQFLMLRRGVYANHDRFIICAHFILRICHRAHIVI